MTIEPMTLAPWIADILSLPDWLHTEIAAQVPKVHRRPDIVAFILDEDFGEERRTHRAPGGNGEDWIAAREQASRDYVMRRAAAGTPEGKAYTDWLESLPPAKAAAEIEDMFALSAPEDKAGDIACDLQMRREKARLIAAVLNGEVPAARRIKGDFIELASQVPLTASDYIAAAVSQIDGHLEEGYAREHPELIAAYMQTVTLVLGWHSLPVRSRSWPRRPGAGRRIVRSSLSQPTSARASRVPPSPRRSRAVATCEVPGGRDSSLPPSSPNERRSKNGCNDGLSIATGVGRDRPIGP
jgi:hypothetical protein